MTKVDYETAVESGDSAAHVILSSTYIGCGPIVVLSPCNSPQQPNQV